MTETDGKICRALGLEVSVLSKWLCYSKQSIGLVCTCSVVSGSLWPQSLYGIFPGKNTGVGYHFLLQGIFQTQGSNPHILRLPSLLHWQADSSPLNPSVSMQSLLSYQWHFSGTVTKKFFFFFIYREIQQTLNSQSYSEKEKQSWMYQAAWLQRTLQSYSKQDYIILALAHKWKYRSMEQDTKSRGKPMHLCSINLWQRRQEYTMEKRQSCQ